MRVFSFQLVAARGLLGWSEKDLALASGISLYAVKKLEGTPGDLEPSKNLLAVAQALTSKGIVFTKDLSRVGVALDTRKR
ncbi:transcriptional regulator [Pelagibacterium halotolerans]|uniref:transcriptional regulator n=1 Tax=Pelagibacterium halotolerans TaxID=531813 RepID=UPI00384ECB02